MLELTPELLNQIHAHGEAAYPEEGAGFLLGHLLPPSPGIGRAAPALAGRAAPALAGRGAGGEGLVGDHRQVTAILRLENAREDASRHNRYLLTPQAYLLGEGEAARLGLDVLGVFHSHPDHPNRPSEFDREWAMPWFTYLITSVQSGQAVESRCWRLAEDRSQFTEEQIDIRESRVESRK